MIKFNKTEILYAYFNGKPLDNIYFNGQPLLPTDGLFDANGKCLASWYTLTSRTDIGGYGMDCTKNYTDSGKDDYKTTTTSPYYILHNKPELVEGTQLIIPDSVTSIGSYAFHYCESLTSVTIGKHVQSIGSEAFGHCGRRAGLTDTTNITIPDSVTRIGSSVFWQYISLQSVTIGNGVESIGSSEFAYCENLTSITLGKNVKSIGERAFEDCSKLTSIHFDSTKARWNAVHKGKNWNVNTGAYTIYCTDGTISK